MHPTRIFLAFSHTVWKRRNMYNIGIDHSMELAILTPRSLYGLHFHYGPARLKANEIFLLDRPRYVYIYFWNTPSQNAME